MIGVTIGVGAVFERMARLAAERFAHFTGVEAVVLGPREQGKLKRPHFMKFALFDLLGDPRELVYFDADLVLCEPLDLETLRSPEGFSAARDLNHCEWIRSEVERAGITADYFNSGLFWAHRSRATMLSLARELRESGEIVSAFRDQTHLNAAAARTGGVHYLPYRLNYHVDRNATDSLAEVTGAHIHWIPKDVPRLERYYREPRSMFWRA